LRLGSIRFVTVLKLFASTPIPARPTIHECANEEEFLIELKQDSHQQSGWPFRRQEMPYDSHQRAAEFHEQAAHAHRVAATQHGKGDHLTAHEQSRMAMEHSAKAYQLSQEAFKQSAAAAGKKE
jgi:hypothetical protein